MYHRPAISPSVPTQSGVNPWSTVLFDGPSPPAVDVNYLAFGQGLVTQDPRYQRSNLPPYRK